MNLSKELEAIFYQALERPENERESFLLAACGDNDRLKDDIAALLIAVDSGKVFFDKLPERIRSLEFPECQTFESSAHDKVGPWQLCEMLGKGGMGAVWLAERADFQYARQVAIKLLPRAEDNPITRQRFRAEQQILAQLNHENIARFIDGGVTEEGVRYMVMDYIKGEPLNIYHQKYALGIRDKLNLFQQICRAVHYAHQHNVVHRDLKPANIMVTDKGEVKLLDFGIAKILDQENLQSEFTRVVPRPLTLAYASPEMLKGEPVTRTTDVYSLGIILYELIAGKKPFRTDTAALQHCEDKQAGLVKKPCTLLSKKALAGLPRKDLDTIVLKAIHSNSNARYSSVQALLDDVASVLVGLPIQARPYSALYYVSRFMLRHTVASVSALAIFLVLSFASIFSFLQMREAQAQRDLATQQQRQVQATNDFLNLLLEEIGPNGEALTLEELLKRGQNMLERQASTQNEPAWLGRVMLELAQGYGSIGNMEESHKLLQRSEHFARLHKDNDLLSIVLCSYSENYISLDFQLVENKYHEARKVQASLPQPSIDSEIVCNKAQAMILEKTGQAEQALKILDSSIKTLQRTSPGSSNLLFQLINLKTHALYSMGEQDLLLETNTSLIELYRQSGRDSTSSYITIMQNQAILLEMMGELLASEEVMEHVIKKFNNDVDHVYLSADFRARYADILYRLGHIKEALDIYYRSLDSAKLNGDVLWVARIHERIAATLLTLDELTDAEHYLSLSEGRLMQNPETNSRRLNSIARHRATLARKKGNLDEALAGIQAVLTNLDYPNSKRAPDLKQPLFEAAHITLAQKNYALARNYIEDLLIVTRSLARKNGHSADIGNALVLQGDLYLLQGDAQRAKRYFSEAAETLLIAAGENHPDTRHARRQLLSISGTELAKN